MVKITRQWSLRSLAVLLVACLPLAAGCGETVVEEEDNSVLMVEDHAVFHFPNILNGRRLKVGNRVLDLKASDISDIELHNRDKSSDGTETAVVSFTLANNPKPLRVKVQVTYKVVVTKMTSGREWTQYPVSKPLETLSVKYVDSSNP